MSNTIVLFTQQTIGLGARKTSMVFLAEAYRDMGFDVHVVTCQLSWLSKLKKQSGFSPLQAPHINEWYDAEGMRGFIYVPPLHPASFGDKVDRFAGPLLIDAYADALPRSVAEIIRRAHAVVIESCSAIALFRKVRALAPDAATICSLSDRLLPVGMNPALHERLAQDAPDYSLIRVPARAMLADYANANIQYFRHGLDKAVFEDMRPNPFTSERNAILIGDMMLDIEVLRALIAAEPDVTFHYFGRVPIDIEPVANFVDHKEVPFDTLIAYLQWADVGLSLYREVDQLDYLAESSLKNIQYEYCGLPIVTPHFAVSGQGSAHGYASGNAEQAVAALRAALTQGKGAMGSGTVETWSQVAAGMLEAAMQAAQAQGQDRRVQQYATEGANA